MTNGAVMATRNGRIERKVIEAVVSGNIDRRAISDFVYGSNQSPNTPTDMCKRLRLMEIKGLVVSEMVSCKLGVMKKVYSLP